MFFNNPMHCDDDLFADPIEVEPEAKPQLSIDEMVSEVVRLVDEELETLRRELAVLEERIETLTRRKRGAARAQGVPS